MELISVPFSMVMLAKRNTGKSILAEYLINKLLDEKKLNAVYIYSKTCQLGDNWLSIPKKYKRDFVDFKKIETILKYQTEQVKKRSKKVKQICLVFDDVIDSSGTKGQFTNMVNEIFSRGRHFHMCPVRSASMFHWALKNDRTRLQRQDVAELGSP